ncbi:MAG TPA: LysR substrate-binding domain-containing protein [Noviherbaspirillum sp.]
MPWCHICTTCGSRENSATRRRSNVRPWRGLGIACLSRYVVEDLLAQGRLVEIKTTLPALQRHFYLIHSRHKILSARLTGFLRFCREWKA